jgi:hypothetical protein
MLAAVSQCRNTFYPARKRNLLYNRPVVPEKPLMSSRESVSYLSRLPRSRNPLSEISTACLGGVGVNEGHMCV